MKIGESGSCALSGIVGICGDRDLDHARSF
jgi:hypothetical protein